MKIIKRDGREVPYDFSKIITAIDAANKEVDPKDRLSEIEIGFIVGRIERRIHELNRPVHVEEIQDMVIDELVEADHARLALHYSEYRMKHAQLRERNTTDKKILALLRHDSETARQENANKDPIINSTMRDYLASEVSEDICRRYIFPEVDNIISVVFKQQANDVLSYVVNVALYRGYNYLSLVSAALRCHTLLYHPECALRCGRRLYQLRQKYLAFFVVLTDSIKCRYQHFVYHIKRSVIL